MPAIAGVFALIAGILALSERGKSSAGAHTATRAQHFNASTLRSALPAGIERDVSRRKSPDDFRWIHKRVDHENESGGDEESFSSLFELRAPKLQGDRAHLKRIKASVRSPSPPTAATVELIPVPPVVAPPAAWPGAGAGGATGKPFRSSATPA